ncbi:MAG: transglutaminase protein [Herbinix sp.]|jgi:hypothetical protein|nr:transglutaminase protein [Herbinix sp.]
MNEQEYYSLLESKNTKVNFISKYLEYPKHNISDFVYHFTYGDEYLRLLKQFNLENIAGVNSTLGKALNIMNWLSKKTYYCGCSNLRDNDINSIIQYSFDKGFDGAINCEHKAILLSDFLIALKIYAQPIVFEDYSLNNTKDEIININCHVCVNVYLQEEEKWVMLDPSFNAYFTDENGNTLNIFDMKRLLKDNRYINLAHYSLNGNSDIFRSAYPSNFIYSMAFRMSIWDGNAINERTYEQNILFPTDVDNTRYYRMKQLANGIDISEVDKNYDKVRYISIDEVLRKPFFD